MEMLKQILMKPLLALLLIIQCAFLIFILTSVPKQNGQLRSALANLRTPSQSNIAPINQAEARELRLLLEQQIDSHRSFQTVCVLFGFLSIALAITLILPLGFKRPDGTPQLEERLQL